MKKLFLMLLTIIIPHTLFAADAVTIANRVSEQRIREHIGFLSGLTSRAVGTEGERKAADYVLSQFQEMGLDNIRVQEFNVAVPVTEKAVGRVLGGPEFKIYPLFPNLVRTSSLPEDGLTAEMIWGGRGEFADFNNKQVKGRVVMMDFNSGDNWLNAGLLGAKAVLFTEPDDTTREQAEQKFLATPIDMPRFWVKREDAIRLKEQIDTLGTVKVQLNARVVWRNVKARNIYAEIPGSDERFKKYPLVIEAYYDSLSVVPDLSPGAESASSIAALLEIARILKDEEPLMPVVFLASSAHHFSLRGMDDFVYRHAQDSVDALKRHPGAKIRRPIEPMDIGVFISLNLSSNSRGFGPFFAGHFYWVEVPALAHRLVDHKRATRHFSEKFSEYTERVCRALGISFFDSFINGIVTVEGRSPVGYLPEGIALNSEIPLAAGIPAFSLVSTNDARNRVFTPLDKEEYINYENLVQKIRILAYNFVSAVEDPKFHPDPRLTVAGGLLRTIAIRAVTFDPREGFLPDSPVPGAVGLVKPGGHRYSRIALGVIPTTFALADEDGWIEISSLQLPPPGAVVTEWELRAYYLDEDTGAIRLAPDRGTFGAQQFPNKLLPIRLYNEQLLVLFECEPINVFELIDPRFLRRLDTLTVLDQRNSIPQSYGYSLPDISGFRPLQWTSESDTTAVVYAEPGVPVKIIGGSGVFGKRLLFTNAKSSHTREESEGEGFPSYIGTIINSPFQAAKDMYYLNEYRIQNMAEQGIVNARLNKLHQMSLEYITKAEEAKENLEWDGFISASRAAVGIASRAYPDVKATASDVVHGVVLYFALLIPFAFFAERLLFGFTDIRQQIAGIASIFIAIYIIMRIVHPAFRLIPAPDVMLLAFIIIALSGIVLSIVISKFEEQMRNMKFKTTKVHATDVGRITASAAAFSLGISNMRKRPQRTFLTCMSLVLLTFTVLSFTSIHTYLKFVRIPSPNPALYDGVLIRDRAWRPLEMAGFDYIVSEFEGLGVISPRAWILPGGLDVTNQVKIESKKLISDQEIFATAILGLGPEEKQVTGLNRYLVSGTWFETSNERSVILPKTLAERLHIKDTDVGKAYITLLGEQFVVRAIMDDGKLRRFRDLDGEHITPVNFALLPRERMQQIRLGVIGEDVGARMEVFPHIDTGGTIILPYNIVLDLGGTTQSVAVRFNENVDMKDTIEDFMTRLAVTVFAGKDDSVFVYSSLGVTSLAGMGNIFVPMLLVSLVILNTMLGSVYERTREIGIYSSVGLAPVHIGSLFLAESFVYAILGAVSGYIVGQVVARFVTYQGLLPGLVLNYSSISTVFATLTIMAVVVLSTVYPSRKASEMAVPDVTRRWILPPPETDEWRFEFPFTVSGAEVIGLFTFLRDYYASYQQETVGIFYTKEINFQSIDTPKGRGYRIQFNCWLSPFDMGVNQKVCLEALPTGDYNIFTVFITLIRGGGQMNDWERLNRRFLNDMRKQFLIWRTVSVEAKQEYMRQGEKETG